MDNEFWKTPVVHRKGMLIDKCVKHFFVVLTKRRIYTINRNVWGSRIVFIILSTLQFPQKSLSIIWFWIDCINYFVHRHNRIANSMKAEGLIKSVRFGYYYLFLKIINPVNSYISFISTVKTCSIIWTDTIFSIT